MDTPKGDQVTVTTVEPSIGSPKVNKTQESGHSVAHDLGERYRDALLCQDLEAAYALFQPNAILHSPILTGYDFDGRDELIQAIRVFMNEANELTFTNIYASEDACTLVFNMRLGGERMDGVFLIEAGADGLVKTISLLIRCLLPVAVFARVFGPALSRHHSLARSVAAVVGTQVATWAVRLVNFVGNVMVVPSIRALTDRAMTLPVKRGAGRS